MAVIGTFVKSNCERKTDCQPQLFQILIILQKKQQR